MKLPRAGLVVLAVVLSAAGATAAPGEGSEADRLHIVRHFEQLFPGVPLEDYVYGAMIASPDARAQYEQIMEFPPFLGDLDAGRRIWEKPFRNGGTFAGCFPDGGRNVVGNYPYYEESSDMVVTFEMALNRCLEANGEAPMRYGEREPMGVLSAYARTLSNGMRMNIEVDSEKAWAKYEAGKDLYYRRIGQLNAACAGCHQHLAGRTMRMEIISPSLGHATHWPIFRAGEELMTFQGRFNRCMEQMRAVPYGYNSEEWNNLEYFLSYLSNGLPLKSSVFRK
ncbi:MAG: sulfur oxidation c-type cytochrome SoxA [Burkholderiales bacterium]|nr:sulfur oxidation c-type cytochrome SoxA [Burkholderiales bacterium]